MLAAGGETLTDTMHIVVAHQLVRAAMIAGGALSFSGWRSAVPSSIGSRVPRASPVDWSRTTLPAPEGSYGEGWSSALQGPVYRRSASVSELPK